MFEMPDPEDKFKKARLKRLIREWIQQNRDRLVEKKLRKCPSCKKDAVAMTFSGHIVDLRCVSCDLKYETEHKTGKEFVDYYNEMRDWYRHKYPDEVIMSCPRCGTGNLVIREADRIKFIGCTNYRLLHCRAYYELPESTISKAVENCSSCSWPLLRCVQTHETLICFNTRCANNWKKIRERKEAEARTIEEETRLKELLLSNPENPPEWVEEVLAWRRMESEREKQRKEVRRTRY